MELNHLLYFDNLLDRTLARAISGPLAMTSIIFKNTITKCHFHFQCGGMVPPLRIYPPLWLLPTFLAILLTTGTARIVYTLLYYSVYKTLSEVLHQLWWKGVATLPWEARDIHLYFNKNYTYAPGAFCYALSAACTSTASGQESSTCWSLTISWRKKEIRRITIIVDTMAVLAWVKNYMQQGVADDIFTWQY